MECLSSPTILGLFRSLGITFRGNRVKRVLRCPLPGHKDSRYGGVIFVEKNRFYCSVCAPGRALSFAELARALQLSVAFEGPRIYCFPREERFLRPTLFTSDNALEVC